MSIAVESEPSRPAETTTPFRPRMLAAFVLPLFFVLMMSATLVTALHSPKPHDLALTIAGPAATTGPLAQGITRGSPGSFDVSVVDTAAEARTAVLRRDAVGAIAISSAQRPTVTVYVASGGGRSAVAPVEAVGTQIAAQLRTTSTVVDLAPLTAGDGLGTGVFYLVVFSSIGGYLTLIVLTQVVPRGRLRSKYLTALTTAVLTPLVVVGLASIFLGGLNLSFGALMAVLGVLALYTFTVALIVVLADQLVGSAALFVVAPLAIFLNLASAGGASPESMLPGFWQALHSFWVGAGANEALRNIVYFPGATLVRWIAQLLTWTLALLVLTLIIEGARLIWRLQSLVLRAQRQNDSLSEHLQLLSVPRQPSSPAALTRGRSTTEHGAASSTDDPDRETAVPTVAG